MNKILVAGASGYIGRYVAHALKHKGYYVRAMVRNPEKIMEPGEHGEPVIYDIVDEIAIADVTRPETLEGICDDIDIVFSSLGMTRPDFRHSSFDIDYEGNHLILEHARKKGVRKFIYISVFNAEKMLDISNIQAHEQFAGELRKSGMDYTVIRPTGYFSDMGQFLNLARTGIMPIPGDGLKLSNPVHGADLAEVCIEAIDRNEKDIDVGGPEIFSYREVAELAFRVLRRPPVLIPLPLWIGDAMLGVARLLNRDIADIISFALAVSRMDSVAPSHGTRRLEDYFREMEGQKDRKNP